MGFSTFLFPLPCSLRNLSASCFNRTLQFTASSSIALSLYGYISRTALQHTAPLILLPTPTRTGIVSAGRFPDVTVIGPRWRLRRSLWLRWYLPCRSLCFEPFSQNFEAAVAVDEKLLVGTAQVVIAASVPGVRTSASAVGQPFTFQTLRVILALSCIELLHLRPGDDLFERRFQKISQSPLLFHEEIAWVDVAAVLHHGVSAALVPVYTRLRRYTHVHGHSVLENPYGRHRLGVIVPEIEKPTQEIAVIAGAD